MKRALKTYKHSISVTGQIFFCAAPIRIDSYDTCQFGCVYCFSRTRARAWSEKGVHQVNPIALRKRLERVEAGEFASALDEFLGRRVPVQLGGLQDPFTPIEADQQATHEILEVLRDFKYPTLISTKGSLLLDDTYLDLLSQMNVVVRISAAGISEELRHFVEPKTDDFANTIAKFETLTARGITCGLRIQPVFPGFEREAILMAKAAAGAGVKQISFEYLKLPSESVRTEIASASAAFGYDIVQQMRDMGIRKLGPDWSLTPAAKRPFVREARALCHELGVNFGAGDTEFIPWSDGNGCCGASELTQDAANHFTGNFVGVIKASLATTTKRVEFSALRACWSPSQSVGNYMDWRIRIPPEKLGGRTDWMALVAKRWNGGRSPYSPSFFDGVNATSDFDEAGFRIYDATVLAAELARLPSSL